MALDSPPTPRHTARPALDVLVTRNLTLRPPLQVDCDSIAEALADPTVSRNLTGVPHPYGVKDAQAWLESFATTYPDDVVYTVHRERLIGVVAVHIRDGKPALGYWFSPCAWGKGYATQAC
ncbi:MAG: GNAT family N-acetyltransferase, partial [Pseudomonadota bacterium]